MKTSPCCRGGLDRQDAAFGQDRISLGSCHRPSNCAGSHRRAIDYRKRPRTHAGILLAVLAFMVVIAVIMAGVLTLAVSHFNVAKANTDYDATLAASEAGVNYELNRISINPENADQEKATGAPGTSYNVTDSSGHVTGTMSVYVTQDNGSNESTPWSWPNQMFIYSTGTVNGIARSVRVGARVTNGSGGVGKYALFSISGGLLQDSGLSINGDVGTDGGPSYPAANFGPGYSIKANPEINGTFTFAGPGSGWAITPGNRYTVFYLANPVYYMPVSMIAQALFPSGGLAYLATNNDNALASPPIVNATVSMSGGNNETFVGKPGGANYYVTSMAFNGNTELVFDNSKGPITIWVGPTGGTGAITIKGGLAATSMSKDASKPVTMYSATTGGITFSGNAESDIGLYAYDGPGVGAVHFNGNQVINGPVVCDTFTMNGAQTLNYVGGFFLQTGTPYLSATATYSELGGAF